MSGEGTTLCPTGIASPANAKAWLCRLTSPSVIAHARFEPVDSSVHRFVAPLTDSGVLRSSGGGPHLAFQLALLPHTAGTQPSPLHPQLHAARIRHHRGDSMRVSPENYVGLLPGGE